MEEGLGWNCTACTAPRFRRPGCFARAQTAVVWWVQPSSSAVPLCAHSRSSPLEAVRRGRSWPSRLSSASACLGREEDRSRKAAPWHDRLSPGERAGEPVGGAPSASATGHVGRRQGGPHARGAARCGGRRDAGGPTQGQPAVASTAARAREPAATPAPAIPAGLPERSYDGKHGSPTWGDARPGLARLPGGHGAVAGRQRARARAASPITFHYKPAAAARFDEGHTLRVVLAPGGTIEIDRHAYRLLQVHFPAPSKHTIAGERSPGGSSSPSGRRRTDRRIGVRYDAGASRRCWQRCGRGGRARSAVRTTCASRSTRAGCCRTPARCFRYTDSSTMPPAPRVLWNVMRRAIATRRRSSTSSPTRPAQRPRAAAAG